MIDINVTTAGPWTLSVYFVGGVVGNETYASKTHTATKQAIRVLVRDLLGPIPTIWTALSLVCLHMHRHKVLLSAARAQNSPTRWPI